MRRMLGGGGAASRGTAAPGELEEIEWTEADEAPPVEPFRWLAGDSVPVRFAAYDVGSRDPTGTAGVWLAIEGLSAGVGHRASRQSPAGVWSPG